MPRESKQTIVFVVPGDRHEAGATRGAGAVGEFAVIDRLVAGRPSPAGVMVGPGDDAAVTFQ